MFFTMSMNSRSLLQNKALFGSNPLANLPFCIEKRADDSETFIRNGGYYCDEEVKKNIFGPRAATKLARERRSITEKARLRHVPITHHHRCVWATTGLGSSISAPSEQTWAAPATIG